MAKKIKEARMNRAILKRWVKMLRSGDYKQGQGALRPDEKTHCCLAVLADAAGARWRRGWYKNYPCAIGNGMNDTSLPERLAKRIGLTSDNQSRLMNFNDEKGWSFKRIATWSEKNL